MRVATVVAWCVVGLLVVVTIAAGALWFGGNRAVAWAIEHPLSGALGRQIHVGGSLTIHWGSPTKALIEDIHVANASWSKDPEMFSAKRLELEFFPLSLLHGPSHIPLIALDGAKLLLETSADGDRNWAFGASSAAPKKRGEFPDLEKLTVRDGALTYRNGVTHAQTDLGLTKLDIAAPDPASDVQFVAEGTFQKQPAHLTATIGPLAELRDTEKPYPVTLKGAIDRIKLAVDGTIKEPLDFDGLDLRISLSGAKLDELTTRLGVPLPTLPDFRGTAELTGGDGEWALKAMTIQLGKSDLEGGLAIDTNAKVPHIEANLTSKNLDLADFTGFYGGAPATSSAPAKPAASDGHVLPDTAIAIHKLPSLNADLSYDATQIKATGGLPLERVSLGLHLKDGAITIKPLRFHAAQGDVDLNLYFTPFTTKGPPHLQADLDIRHIDLHQLLGGPTMSPMVKQTAGIAGGFIKIETNGVSLREFLGRMDGDAGLFLENGQLSQLLDQLAPIDALGALGVYVRGDKPVPIECAVSRFDIKNGIATAATLLVNTNNATIVGKGNINFAEETLALNLSPYNKSITAFSLRTPVDVQGTFAKPLFHLRTGEILTRLGAAVGLGVVFPPAALLPLIDTGLGDQNACSKAYAAQRPPGTSPPTTGSSTPRGG
jgi:uncharacterized protein involved in outer membrane biogenesis